MRRRDLVIHAGAMISARRLRAQEKAMPVIGFLGAVVGPTDLAADHVNRKVDVIVAAGGNHARPRAPFLAASMREIHRIWRPSARKPDGARARIGSTWYPTA
jgi:hypothetical protein